jgi:VWFA-related protein
MSVLLFSALLSTATGQTKEKAKTKQGTGKNKVAAVIVTPQKNKMWVGQQPVTIRLNNISAKKLRLVEVYLDGRLIKELMNPPFAFRHDFGVKGNNRTLKVLVRGRDLKVIARAEQKSFQADDSHDVEVKRVVVPVVVKDKNGNYVRGLEKEDFEVLSDGRRVEISFFEVGGTTRFNMAQVIDISYSMKDKIHDVLKAAGNFMTLLLTPNDRGVFVFFNHYIFDHTGLTDDTAELMETLELQAPAVGETALYDAVVYTLNLMSKHAGWNIIVLFSDGEDTSSYIDRESMLQKVKKSAVVIYAIDNQEGIFGRRILKEICDLSGGDTFPLDNVKKTRQVYQRIREDIKARYILYISPKHRGSPRFHTLDVSVKGKKYEIRTLKGYY